MSTQVNQIKDLILAKEVSIAQAKAARSYYMQHYGYQMAQFEQEIYELNIRLQLAEADATFYTSAQAAAEDQEVNQAFAERDGQGQDEPCGNCGYQACRGYSLCLAPANPCPTCANGGAPQDENEDQDDPCYHCGRAIHSCMCANFDEESAADAPAVRSEGTKLKWVSSSDPETYRIAIVKKHGVLEVKSVTDGRGYCHNSATCQCNPCSEINLSARLGVARPPWLGVDWLPLTKTFFETEAAWLLSLPEGGTLTATETQLSNRQLKKLCTKPLVMLTDGGRLEELEKRFPGAKMVLTTNEEQFEICSMNDGERKQFRLYCEKKDEIRKNFSDFGVPKGTKPNLAAEWKGLFISLSHLF